MVVPLVQIQKKYLEILKVLNVTSAIVNLMQDLGIKYLNNLERLVRKGRIVVEVDRAHLRLHIQNYTHLDEQATNIIATYA